MGADPGPRGPPGRSPGRTRPPGPGPSVRCPCWPGELMDGPSGAAPGVRVSPPDRPSTPAPRHAGAGIEQGTLAPATPPVAIGRRGRLRGQARSLRGRNSSGAGPSRRENRDPRGPTRRSRLRHSALVVGAVCAGPTPEGEGDGALSRPGNALAATCRSLAHRSKAPGRRAGSIRVGAGSPGRRRRRNRGRGGGGVAPPGSSPGRAVWPGERTRPRGRRPRRRGRRAPPGAHPGRRPPRRTDPGRAPGPRSSPAATPRRNPGCPGRGGADPTSRRWRGTAEGAPDVGASGTGSGCDATVGMAPSPSRTGGVAERLKAPVLKTGMGA